ncbi:MAG: Lon protease 2 [Verrucomicrobia subdivision 3 bacterium]|nr:Lon protease 2 [Limisphaerales bacterium]MCS1414313.1 Lon protease 2 [Limisphaerales bacterium]
MAPGGKSVVDILEVSAGPKEPQTAAQESIPKQIPILGLSDIVIFPGMIAPLLIESAEGGQLINDVVAGNRYLGLVLQKNAEAENPTPDDLWEHGCLARIQKMVKGPEESVRILIEGLERFKIKHYVTLEPYLIATLKVLPVKAEDSPEITALIRTARKQFERIAELSSSINEEAKLAILKHENPGLMTDLMVGNLNVQLDDQQSLLETCSVKERLNLLLPLLSREFEVLKLGSKIQKDVSAAMSKSQRDFFLREQIRAIQKELGETDPTTSELNSLREQMKAKGLTPEARTVCLKELDRLQRIPSSTAEYTVARSYVEWLIELPWSQSTPDKLDLDTAAELLDAQHHGLTKVKERLLEFLAVIKLKKHLKGPILCLVGPPGVGKTSLGMSVASALGRKFARIALGGMRDEAEIRGHRRTYVGALPGRIIQSLRRLQSNNPVILLDEFDKMSADLRGDPASALLEVLDPQQNANFTDHYLDVPFDLSRVLFITTANWIDPVHPALQDRVEVIELPSYTQTEKLLIAKRHLIPHQLSEHGLKKSQVKFGNPVIKRLISGYTREAGVRQLDRQIASVTRKAAKHFATRSRAKPITISNQWLTDKLGPDRYHYETAEIINDSGIAVGLAWTPSGGEILYIEATQLPGRGNLILTGSLGDVMKESAQAALTFLRSQAVALNLKIENVDKQDIHIHVPTGATPKDGPSAGVAIAAALASLFTRRRIRSDVAMTGEVSLRGRVLPVGGIREKALAAFRSGFKTLLIPDRNRNDWREVPDEVKKRVKVHFVKQVSDIIRLSLLK